MEIITVILCIATFILWVLHLAAGDRINGLRYRVQQLEKNCKRYNSPCTQEKPLPPKPNRLNSKHRPGLNSLFP